MTDLELAQRCCRGDDRALDVFEKELLPKVRAAVARIDGSPGFVDEVLQQTRIRLLVGDKDQKPKLLSFDGRGGLVAWMRVVAVRVALGIKRHAARQPVTEDLDDGAAGAIDDPELAHLKATYHALFHAALRKSLESLGPRERTVLRLKFVDRLTIDAISRVYRVHKATVKRWIARAREKTRLGMYAELSNSGELTQGQAESLLKVLESDLELSLSLLAEQKDAQ